MNISRLEADNIFIGIGKFEVMSDDLILNVFNILAICALKKFRVVFVRCESIFYERANKKSH